MSPCEEFLPLILEGEPHELRGEGDSRLAAHVRTCPRCAHVATQVLGETDRLDAFLVREPTRAQIDAVLERSGWEGAPPPVGAATPPRSAAGTRRGVRRWTLVAAAAAVGALLLLPVRSVPPGPGLPAASASRPPTVEAMSGQRVAVMETENPEITVLWFF